MTTSKTDPTPTPIRVAAEAATEGSAADASAVPSVSQQSADLRTAVSKGSAEQASSPDDGPPLTLEFLLPAEQPDELGRLAEYRVLKELGHGGMGAVFLAEDPKLKRKVALKVMLPQVARVAVNRERFLREAQAAAQLEHDNVVSVYQVSEANGVPFIAMPFLKGESLQARLQREGTLPVSEVIRIGQQIAEGLAAAHEQDLVHRDIKPGNIWLEDRAPRITEHPDRSDRSRNREISDERATNADRATPVDRAPVGSLTTSATTRVKILDFGLARLATSTEAQHLTTSGTILGTPSYMAPEQARGSHDVDFRCDLFSLGAVLYRMATGRQPFSGETIFALLTSLGIDTPAAPCDLNPNIPRELSDLILQLLAKPPEARPAHAREVASRLAALAEIRSRNRKISDDRATPVDRAPDGSLTTSATKTPETHDISTVILPATEQRRRRKTLRIGLALVACVVLAGIILQITQDGPTPRSRSRETSDDRGTTPRSGSRETSEKASSAPDRSLTTSATEKADWPEWAKELREPPPLEEWLKGRKVLTVQQDGSAMFQTIQAALDKVQPGEVIRVLDKGPYRERLVSFKHSGNFGLVSDVNTVIELAKWELEPKFKTSWIGHIFSTTRDLRISGFTFVSTPPLEDKSLDPVPIPNIIILQELPGLCFEDCAVLAPQRSDDPQSNVTTDCYMPIFAVDFACVRSCVFGEGFRIGPSSSSASYVAAITHNIFVGLQTNKRSSVSIELQNASHRVWVYQNVFASATAKHAIQFAVEKDVMGDDWLLLTRNTFTSNSGTTLIVLANSPGHDVTIRDNLLAASTRGFFFAAGAESFATKAREEWLVSNNWGGQRFPDTYLVPLTDPSHTGELPYLSLDAEHPNFLRLDPAKLDLAPATSPTSRSRNREISDERGTADQRPEVSRLRDGTIIPGALPPGPPPPAGDWFTRLQSRLREAQAASRAQYK